MLFMLYNIFLQVSANLAVAIFPRTPANRVRSLLRHGSVEPRAASRPSFQYAKALNYVKLFRALSRSKSPQFNVKFQTKKFTSYPAPGAVRTRSIFRPMLLRCRSANLAVSNLFSNFALCFIRCKSMVSDAMFTLLCLMGVISLTIAMVGLHRYVDEDRENEDS